ncbi:OB-fold domain-containing protein [Neobacillus sp. GCM10023253]|uniref:OB-fold domain-containing protein n=1 Tax=Neobacillus sp. GCM10023253 TaxID=3252644 RepID=UPI003610063A
MNGIISYGAYIPYNRLKRKRIGEFFGKHAMGGEKAIAGYDEDSVSMGVEAAMDCLREMNPDQIDAIYFATTSSPYREKGSIPTLATALNLRESVRGMETAASLRSGTAAIMAAKPGENTLVIAADCRTGAPTGQNEQWFGDGSAALLIGSGPDVIANMIDYTSVQGEVISHWRSQSDLFTQSWEERLSSSAFMKQVKESVSPFLEKNDRSIETISKVIISGPTTRAHLQAAQALGFSNQQVQNPLFDNVGLTGNAHAPMMLVSALEEANPGDQLLVVSFAEGLDLLLLEVTEAISRLGKRKGVQEYVSIKNDEVLYSDYLKWREIIKTEPPRRPPTDRPSAPALHRGYQQNLGFIGSKCRNCGTAQFPKQRVCVQCQAKDEMEDYRFVGQSAKVTTFTLDYLAASPAPPMIVAVIDFDQGGRIICEVTDCHPKEIEIGMEVEMTFRRLFEAGGISNYFWKARPIRKKEGV